MSQNYQNLNKKLFLKNENSKKEKKKKRVARDSNATLFLVVVSSTFERTASTLEGGDS